MGVVSSLVFAKRNVDKIADGDVGRAPVPIFQGLGAIAGVATLAKSAGFSKASKGIENLFGAADGLLNKAHINKGSKAICATAADMVNPLLCVASAVRVLRDEDKGSALIEEGLAMSSMFAGEAIFKAVRKEVSNSIQRATPVAIATDLTSCKEVVRKLNFKTMAGSLNSLFNGKYGKWLKLAVAVLADLAFVTTSIYCFDKGKELGKAITGRDKQNETKPVQSIIEQPMQPLVKSLAVKA